MCQRWEYLVTHPDMTFMKDGGTLDADGVAKWLDSLGRNGWELASAESYRLTQWVFKRPVRGTAP